MNEKGHLPGRPAPLLDHLAPTVARVLCDIGARVARAREALDDGETWLARQVLEDLEHEIRVAVGRAL